MDPLERALKYAELSIEEIDSFEILGGGLRVPKVQERLSEYLNGRELNMHMNGDEAMSFGAAFIAANFSNSFKVRNIFVSSVINYPIYINVTELEESEPVEGEEPFFKNSILHKKGDRLGIKKTLSLNHDKDLAVTVYTECHGTEYPLFDYKITGVNDLRTGAFEGLPTPKISMYFELLKTGVLRMNRAEAKLEEPPKMNATEEAGSKEEEEEKAETASEEKKEEKDDDEDDQQE